MHSSGAKRFKIFNINCTVALYWKSSSILFISPPHLVVVVVETSSSLVLLFFHLKNKFNNNNCFYNIFKDLKKLMSDVAIQNKLKIIYGN